MALDDSKVARLALELANVRTDDGLSDPGRLSECPLLMETAARICHPKGDKGEPLLDAIHVLRSAVQELSDDDILIFNSAYAIGKGNWAPKLMARRSDLGLHFNRDAKTIYRWEKRILRKVALKIVEREQQAILAEAERQSSEQQTPSPEPDISVENIEATLVLNENGKPIGRESSFTVRALHSLADSRTTVLEFNNGEFRIDNTLNCTVLNPRDFFALAELDIPEGKDVVNLFEGLFAAAPDKEAEDLLRLKMLTRKVGESLGNILRHQQALRQAQEEMSRIISGFGVSDGLAIDVPPLEAGESLTFSYDTSYIRPLDKDTVVSYGAPLHPPTYTLAYSHDVSALMVVAASLPLPRVTLRVRASQPLEVVPHLQAPGTPQFWSMPVVPFGYINTLKRAPDGSYEHTFRDLAPRSSAVLIWFAE